MKYRFSIKSYNPLFLLILCLLFLYILVRAASLEITNDEAYSFHNVKFFWYAEALCTPNTHWLNSLAIKAAILCGLENNLGIRWLSILSSFVFLSVGYCWIRSTKKLPDKFIVLSLALLNPFILDYFSLARGYASGLMFQALALLLFMLGINRKNRNLIFISLLCSGISAVSNFGFFFFFIGFSLVYFYECYFKKGFCFLKQKNFYADLIYSLSISAIILRALLFIKRCSTFEGLSDGDSFVDSLFGSYIDGLTYTNFSYSNNALHILALSFCALVLFASIIGLLKYKEHNSKLYVYSSYILLIMLGLFVINKFCFYFLYPSYRTSIMLSPIISIVLCCFAIDFLKQSTLKKIILYFISMFLNINFLLSINLKSTFDCKSESETKSYFNFLKKAGAKYVGMDILSYGPFVNYYQITNKYAYSFNGEAFNSWKNRKLEQNESKLKKFDYLILASQCNLEGFKSNSVTLEIVKNFPNTKTAIAKVTPRDKK